MKRHLWLVVAAAAGLREAQAATVAVKITGLSETAYELNVSGIRKSGRLSSHPGPSTVRDSVEIGGLRHVTAGLVFTSASGVIATCPEVQVAVPGSAPVCEPAFILTERRAGSEGFLCESRCERPKAAEKSEPPPPSEGEEEDWQYAAEPAPLVDGWSHAARDTANFQSFYTGVMFDGQRGRVYSSAERGL